MDTVLIVDSDHAESTEISKKLKALKRFDVLAAADAKSAVDILNNTKISVLISGMTLFGFGGVELIAYMTRSHPKIPCIALLDSGQSRPWFNKPKLHEDVLHFIEKPLEDGTLAATISSCINLINRGLTAKGMALTNFLPLIVTTGKTCQADVKTGRKKIGRLYFSKGALADARWEKKIGDAALMEMLGWDSVKISISKLPVSIKSAKIEVALMDKIGVSWKKQAETPVCLPQLPDYPPPDPAVVTKLESSLKKYVGILKTIKGYKGLAILSPNGKVLAADIADKSIDFNQFSADFAAILNQSSKTARLNEFEKCTCFSMHTPKGIIIMMPSDVTTSGNFRFIVLMSTDGNAFFMQVQLEKTIPQILNI
jgi:CheY-like chemotaxis protein/predicted regulator of Ras-like GTPase activity (Roadblock/LC7/MglB family)